MTISAITRSPSATRHATCDVAVIGAGPYGLSIAAHLKASNVTFRIFGRAMDSWLAHMPGGMLLKSDGFASNICDPRGKFTLKQFCAERGIDYADAGLPIRLETFCEYGLAFVERVLPELEEKMVEALEPATNGFLLRLNSGERVAARRVVIAVGITHFQNVPENLAHLPARFLSHSSLHHDLEQFRGRSVVVAGGGASAIDLAYLLRERGANVEMVVREPELKFHAKPQHSRRTLWQRIRRPQSGLGSGWRSLFCTAAPLLFHCLPQRFRLKVVRRHLGPSGGWFAKEKVIGCLPLHLGCTIARAQVQADKVHLSLRAVDGSEREIVTDHVIAATGYKVDVSRLAFLSTDLAARLHTVECAPVLTRDFECSIPGLYFVGTAAANSFGPMMRFAFGAGFTARRLTRALSKSLSRGERVELATNLAMS